MQSTLNKALEETYKSLSRDPEPRDDKPLLDGLETISELREKLELYSGSILWAVFQSNCTALEIVSNDDCDVIPDKLDALWKTVKPWIATRESMVESLLDYHVYRTLKLIYSNKCGLSNETRLTCRRVAEHQSSHRLQCHFWLREPTHMLRYTPQAIRNHVVENKECLENLTRVLLCFDILSTEIRDYDEILARVNELLSRYREGFHGVPLDYASMEAAIRIAESKPDREAKRSKLV